MEISWNFVSLKKWEPCIIYVTFSMHIQPKSIDTAVSVCNDRTHEIGVVFLL